MRSIAYKDVCNEKYYYICFVLIVLSMSRSRGPNGDEDGYSDEMET